MAGAMVGVVLLVALIVFGGALAALASAVAVAGCAWCWYLQPLRRRLDLQRRHSTAATVAAPDVA